MDRPIMLVGLPGAGKSTLGPMLAERLRLPFHDSDAAIEQQAGLRIDEIFARRGELYFRALERQILEELVQGPASVVASGGGAFGDPETRARALTGATAIWLDVPIDRLLERLQGSSPRPLLSGDPEAKLAGLKAVRDPLYTQAHLRIEASGTVASVLEAIIRALKRAG